MDAREVINQINVLAPEERAKVINYVQGLVNDGEMNFRTAEKKEFDDASSWVFKEHSELMRKLSQ